MKKSLFWTAVLVALSAAVISCGNSSSNNQHKLSGLAFRAFVSNPLFASGGLNSPVLNIVNASKDTLSPSVVSLAGTASQPGLMALSPDLRVTAVFSPAGDAVAVIENASEGPAPIAGTSATISSIPLPGPTESMFIGNNDLAFAGVPTATVTGEAPGAVAVFSVANGAVVATIPVPAAHFIAPTRDNRHVLVFSDGSDAVTIITVALIGTHEDPRTTVCCFDHPVWAVAGSDNNTAYVLSCGAECNGVQASIGALDVLTGTIVKTVPVPAATYGMVSGGILYVAGTAPGTPCGGNTAAKNCGTLTMLNASSLHQVGGPVTITNGYHDRMGMSSNGQLFVGANSCTSINSGGEVRGCLAIVNTTNSNKVTVPPQVGDATGIAPVPGRNIVYVCQDGVFQIFDTTTDMLLVQTTPTVIVGQSFDVKIVDPPPS